ncbi:MAG TPA: hypothetical protein PKH77_17760 [Anaerolineae bacterium]|nr:hypothetical protein [Anaerolineae bacterium]
MRKWLISFAVLLLMGCSNSQGHWAALSPPSPVVTMTESDVVYYYDADVIALEPLLYPYIVQRGDNSWLRLRVAIADSEWITGALVLVDGKRHPLSIVGVYPNDRLEWIDLYATSADIDMVKDLAFSSECAVELIQIDENVISFPLTDTEKSIALRTLALFERMGHDLGR